MSWRIDFSRDSLKFLENNNLKEDFIAEFQFEYCRVYIDKIDWRGNVYKQ